MRLWFSGPRILGVRPGISIPLGATARRPPAHNPAGQAITGAFVYVVRGDHNLTKIGVTTNPRARLAQLRTGSGFPIDYALIAAAEGDAYAIEQAAHQILDAHRVNGEWFDVSPEMAQAALWGAAAKLNQRMQQVSLADSDKVLQIAAAGGLDAIGADLRWQPTDWAMFFVRLVVYMIAAVIFLLMLAGGPTEGNVNPINGLAFAFAFGGAVFDTRWAVRKRGA